MCGDDRDPAPSRDAVAGVKEVIQPLVRVLRTMSALPAIVIVIVIVAEFPHDFRRESVKQSQRQRKERTG